MAVFLAYNRAISHVWRLVVFFRKNPEIVDQN